jgi:hypothetical protein
MRLFCVCGDGERMAPVEERPFMAAKRIAENLPCAARPCAAKRSALNRATHESHDDVIGGFINLVVLLVGRN